MKASCLINNFNYAQYLGEAIESALKQTEAFHEIIVVDDGSQDNSKEIVQKYSAKYPQVKLIAQNNMGQLSCFNAGVVHSTGDLICFLDADDVYKTNYLEEIINYYKQNTNCDFLFCAHELFGETQTNKEVYPYKSSRQFGSTKLLTFLSNYPWIGSATSMLSARKEVLKQFLPFPNKFSEQWITKADDCLIHAVAAVEGNKHYLHKVLVKYRRHSSNDSSAKQKIRKNPDYRKKQMNVSFKFFRYLILTFVIDKTERRLCLLHLLDKFQEISVHYKNSFWLKASKWSYLPQLVNCLWKESYTLDFERRFLRTLIATLAYSLNLKGSFNKFY